MKISVWGKELNAWVAAAALSKVGNHVTLASLTPGHFETDLVVRNEPGLIDLLREQHKAGRLQFSDASAPYDNDVHWLAFGSDTFNIAEEIVKKIAKQTHGKTLLINQSYFNIGATEQLDNLLDSSAGQFIAYVPSTLSEGSALRDFENPSAFIIGCDYKQSFSQIRALFRPFLTRISNLQLMSAREAEFTKFSINGMLALRLGYINEMANLADSIGVDIERVRDAMTCDYRIGPYYLEPGCGFGGKAFSNYIRGLVETFQNKKISSLLNTLLSENEAQKELPFKKLWQHYNSDLSGKTIALWGASFKPLSASISNAPSLKIIDALLAQGCKINIHDPAALENIRNNYPDETKINYCDDMYDALTDCEGLILSTAWLDYKCPDYSLMKERMAVPVIIDGRNIYDRDYLSDIGFVYYGVGR